MARVTVEDCLKNVDNLFQLVLIAARRARQIHQGAQPRVPEDGDKPTVIALREIAAGQVGPDILDEQEEPLLRFETPQAAAELSPGELVDEEDVPAARSAAEDGDEDES